MEVILASNAGACYGVQRALDLAQEAARSSLTAQTLGPLIHNPQVVSDLSREGVSVADRVEDVTAQTIIIRSHGVPPSVMKKACATGCKIIDATCPYVIRAQRAARDLAQRGYHVIVVGERSHPEVEGLCAFAREGGADALVATSPDELPDDLVAPIGVVVQTTQVHSNLQAIIEAIRDRGIEPCVEDTICSATGLRQEAAAELSKHVDAMVVVGGHNSANTTHLFEICSAITSRAYHIESLDELPSDAFMGCSVIGVTAGASTPERQISAVVKRLRQY